VKLDTSISPMVKVSPEAKISIGGTRSPQAIAGAVRRERNVGTLRSLSFSLLAIALRPET